MLSTFSFRLIAQDWIHALFFSLKYFMTPFRLIPLLASMLCAFPVIGAEHSLFVTAIVPHSWNFGFHLMTAKPLPLNYSTIHGMSLQVATTIQHNGAQPGTPNHYLIALRKPVALSHPTETRVPMNITFDGVALSDKPSTLWTNDDSAAQAPGKRDALVDIAQHEPGPLTQGHYSGDLNILLTPAL